MSSAGAVFAGLASLAQIASSHYTNQQNLAAQMRVNDQNIGMQLGFNADQIAVAQMNNQTQIDLANTAHQREVQDLRDANLNPILSATGGNGAAMPSLSGANGAAPSIEAERHEDPLKALGTSAREIGRYIDRSYELELEQQKELVRSLQIANEADESDMVLSKRRNKLLSTQVEAEYEAYKRLENLKDVTVRKHPFIPLNDEVINDISSGILSDIHERKWKDVRGWLKAANETVGTLTDLIPAKKRGKAAAGFLNKK